MDRDSEHLAWFDRELASHTLRKHDPAGVINWDGYIFHTIKKYHYHSFMANLCVEWLRVVWAGNTDFGVALNHLASVRPDLPL